MLLSFVCGVSMRWHLSCIFVDRIGFGPFWFAAILIAYKAALRTESVVTVRVWVCGRFGLGSFPVSLRFPS